MKKLIFIYLIFHSLATVAQEWKPMTIDDSVQVSLPSGYTKADTLGQTIINAKSSFGNIVITKQPDNPATTPDIERVKHLDRYYDDLIKRIKSTSKGIITNERDTLVSRLRAKAFTLEVDSGSGKQYRNFRILHENGATYTFQFLYRDIHQQYATVECDTFFKSIKIPPEIGIKTQFTDPENTTGKTPGSENNLLLVGGGILLIIIIIVIVVLRKRRRH